MTTFSQLVDSIVRETRRPDLLPDICQYLTQTIREAHFTPEHGAVIHYHENRREEQLTSTLQDGFSWAIPRPALFQSLEAVRYDSVSARDGRPVYAVPTNPSRAMQDIPYGYYRAGNKFFFSNYGGLNAIVSLAYFEYPRELRYFAAGTRPAEWDIDAQDFIYADAFDASDELRLDARNFTSNWLLLRWAPVLAEGLKAKVYKRVSDDTRSRTSYSLYSQLRVGLFTSEKSVGGRLG